MKEKINLTIETTTKEILKKISDFNDVSMSQFVDDLVRNYYDENWMKIRPSHLDEQTNQNNFIDSSFTPPELLDLQNEIERLEKLKYENNSSIELSLFFLRKMFNERCAQI